MDNENVEEVYFEEVQEVIEIPVEIPVQNDNSSLEVLEKLDSIYEVLIWITSTNFILIALLIFILFFVGLKAGRG